MIAPVDDLDRLMAIMAVSFDPQYGEAWTRRQVEDAMLGGLCHYHIHDAGEAQESGIAVPAGFYLARHVAGEEELLLLAVSPAHRGQGIGAALLQTLLRDAADRGANRIHLEMREGNFAEHLYLKFGFLPIGRRSNYYRNGLGSSLDAITFSYEL